LKQLLNKLNPKNNLTFSPGNIEHAVPIRFEEQVQKYSARIAVKDRDSALTYGELFLQARNLARHLIEIDPVKNRPVTVYLPHSASCISSILGILFAGKCFLPIDPEYPDDWAKNILAQLDSVVLITDTRGLDSALLKEMNIGTVINFDQINSSRQTDGPSVPLFPGDNAYIIFTSGTAGKPKGVVHSHRNVMRVVKDDTNSVQIKPQDRISLVSSCSFSMSVIDIFSTLMNGAGLYLYDIKKQGIARLPIWVNTEKITIFQSVTTLFTRMAESLSGQDNFPHIRLIKLGGEPVCKKHFQIFQTQFSSGCVLMNGYGSSEILQASQYISQKETAMDGPLVPIGFPTPDVEILLLDENKQPVKDGEQGEIHIRSRFLARRYWKQPHLTIRSFLPDPEGGDKRIFRTEDIGRRDGTGCITHLGRKGNEVKVRGNLINTTVAEDALLDHPSIKEAIVKVTQDSSGDNHLTALMVSWSRIRPGKRELRTFLDARLPSFYIPSRFQYKQQLPLTVTGKIDRKSAGYVALLKPAWKTLILPELTSSQSAEQPGCWLIITDEEKLGLSFQAQLKLNGHKVNLCHPCGQDDYDQLLKKLTADGYIPNQVLYIRNNPAMPKSSQPKNPDMLPASRYSDTIELCRALVRRLHGRAVKFHIISGPVNHLTGQEKIDPDSALVLGPARVLPHENPRISCSFMDIDPEDVSSRPELFITRASQLLNKNPVIPYSAYRKGTIFIPEWSDLSKSSERSNASFFRKNGVFLITGGLGGIGWTLAEFLSAKAAAKLILIGRSPLPSREKWTARLRKNNMIDIAYYQADVTDSSQLRKAVEDGAKRFGPVNGVIHAAGTAGRDSSIAVKDWKESSRVLAPKINGTENLKNIFTDSALDFFILCSSMTAITGRPGQVDYTAANAFLDSFAQSPDNRRSRPLDRVEDMASAYLEEILQLQPEGPYFLGGRCFGSMIAVEMALQLMRQGKDVAALAAIEGRSPHKKLRPGNSSSYTSEHDNQEAPGSTHNSPDILELFNSLNKKAGDSYSTTAYPKKSTVLYRGFSP
jgi:amino acid adenylation domain-containing protein